jgi:hypothetical protein
MAVRRYEPRIVEARSDPFELPLGGPGLDPKDARITLDGGALPGLGSRTGELAGGPRPRPHPV